MQKALLLAAISMSLALVTWLVNGEQPDMELAAVADALEPEKRAEPATSEPAPDVVAARGAALLTTRVPADSDEVTSSADAHGLDVAQIVSETNLAPLQQLDLAIAHLSDEIASLPAIDAPRDVEREYQDMSRALSTQIQEIKDALTDSDRIVEGEAHERGYDPSLIVIHRSNGDKESHIVIPREDYPDLYAKRAELQRFAENSGIHSNRVRTTKLAHLSTLKSTREQLAGTGE